MKATPPSPSSPASAARAAVAVVDVGSNSIKALVAARPASGAGLELLWTRTLDVRISAGISRSAPRLGEAAMAAGVKAIAELLGGTVPWHPRETVVVATSAVRDACNGREFRDLVRAATGQAIRILTGDEEANLIGRGLTCDPAIGGQRDFSVFDLGGGSLECLAFRARSVVSAASLPLGCVRLTERFVRDPGAPLDAATRDAIEQHVRETLAASTFRLPRPAPSTAIATGGTMTVTRAILALRRGQTLETSPAEVRVGALKSLLDELAALSLAERRTVPGLPPARADVMPAALATLHATAAFARVTAFRHSFYNLRYGLADEALDRLGTKEG